MREYLKECGALGVKKNQLQPPLKKTWCVGEMTGAYLAKMERILRLYQQPFDEQYPVLCYDERPCFLIGEIVRGLLMKSGQIRREHYGYEKKGSCALLGSMEPLTGRRLFAVFDQRRQREFALHFTPSGGGLSEGEENSRRFG